MSDRPSPRPGRHLAMAAVALLAACGSSTEEPRRELMTGRLAGRPWIAPAAATLVQGRGGADTLYVGSHGYDAQHGELSIGVRLAPFTGAGRYALGPDDVRVSELVGGDVLVGEFAADGAGTVEITSFAGAGGAVAGRIAFTATRSRGTRGSLGPTVRLDDGVFRAVAVPCCPPPQSARQAP